MRPLRHLATAALILGVLTGCSSSTEPKVLTIEQQAWDASLAIDLATFTKLSSGVYIKDAVVGTGATVTGASTIRVYYSGYLANGTKFDSNVGSGVPFVSTFGNLIAGWSSGMQGMKVGGKRRLLIPSSLGYGSSGAGNGAIPANANLIFDIELVGLS